MKALILTLWIRIFPHSAYQELKLRYKTLREHSQRLEDMLANRSGGAVLAQSLTVSQHAIHQSRTRLNYTGSDEDIRKRIYKLAMRNLHTLNRFEDGEYELDRNSRCRIRDNTVVTVVKRRGSKH